MNITVTVLAQASVQLVAAGNSGPVTWWRATGARVDEVGTGNPLVDNGPPLNLPLTYYATDSAGTVVADPVTVTSAVPLLSSTLYGGVQPVVILSQPPLTWEGRSVWHPVIDRPDPLVSVWPASYPSGTLTLRMADSGVRRALLGLLEAGDPLLLRSTCPDAVDDMVMLPLRWSDPLVSDSNPTGPRRLVVEYQAVTRPTTWLPGPDRTYALVLDQHVTYQEVLDLHRDYQHLLTGGA
jgi:hypothetical protein